MKKFFLLTLFICLCVVNSVSYGALITLKPTSTSIGYTSVGSDIPSLGDPYYYTPSSTTGAMGRMLMRDYIHTGDEVFEISRGFCDFKLSDWYALGVPSGNIISITFLSPVTYWGQNVSINFYARTDTPSENGSIIFADDNDSSVCSPPLAVINHQPVDSTVEVIVTGANLQYFLDDINANNDYTGVTARIFQEIPSVFSYTDHYYYSTGQEVLPGVYERIVQLDADNDTIETKLIIEYRTEPDPQPAVPEPASILLIGVLVGLNMIRTRFFKK